MSLSDYEAAAKKFDTTQARLDVLTREAESVELNRLALLSSLEYARERTATAKRLDILVGLLDKEIEERKRTLLPKAPQGNGQPLQLPELEPAADPVMGSPRDAAALDPGALRDPARTCRAGHRVMDHSRPCG